MATVKSLNSGIDINGKTLYFTPTGLKLGVKGKVSNPCEFLTRVDKSTARKVRKFARKAGRLEVAKAKRVGL